MYEEQQADSTNSATALDVWDRRSKNAILEDAPFSAGEFEEAWAEVCAFEHENVSWIPTAALLVKVWEIVITTAAIRGLMINDSFSEITIASMVEEEGFPAALLEAVLARVSANNHKMTDGHARLDRAKCISWVGAVLLQSLGGEIAMSKFLTKWLDNLPEAWRDATLKDLRVGDRRASN